MVRKQLAKWGVQNGLDLCSVGLAIQIINLSTYCCHDRVVEMVSLYFSPEITKTVVTGCNVKFLPICLFLNPELANTVGVFKEPAETTYFLGPVMVKFTPVATS